MKFGKLLLSHRVIYSPLAGVSDFPFRKMSARHGPPALMYCEMVKTEPVIRGVKETLRMLDFDESMRPIGAQICGSDPKLARQAAKIIEDLGFDTVDLNCGCPVDKVTKQGCGSGMLKTPALIGECLAEMCNVVQIPVTLKVRAGWDDSCINCPEITQIAEKAGAVAIFVHGRTRQQAYRGPAKWDHIRACKAVAKEIVVIGNGDVFSGKAAAEMMMQTNCDAVLVSRGTMGQPWIAKEILAVFEGRSEPTISEEMKKQALLEHFDHSCAYKDERCALIDLRRILGWYIKDIQAGKHFRKKVMASSSIKEARDLITQQEWPIVE